MGERRGLFGRTVTTHPAKPKALSAKQYGTPNTKGRLAAGEVTNQSPVSREDRNRIYRQNALYRKAVLKHSGDLVKEWVDVVDMDGNVLPANDEWNAWTRSTGAKKKIRDALVSAHAQDDGIIELVWDDDGSKPSDPVPPGARLIDVSLLPRRTTNPVLMRQEAGGYRLGAKHRPLGGEQILFHPDRVHVLQVNPDVEDVGGLSTAEAAYHPALSMIQADSALGPIVKHHGPGFKWGKVTDDDQETIDALESTFKSEDELRGLATGSNVEIVNFDASDMDVSSVYDAIYISIAAAVGMPVDTLKGVQAGAVTGSETNRTDYQDAIRESREMNLDDLMVRLIDGVLGEGDWRHAWRPFPSSPADEAIIFRDRMLAVEAAVRAGIPLRIAVRESGLEIDMNELPESTGPDMNGLFPPGG